MEYIMIKNFRDFQDDSDFSVLRVIKNKMVQSMSYFMFRKTKGLEYAEEQQVLVSYINMYFALVVVNWCRRNTLGYAMQQALEQMGSFVQSKTREQNHPMTSYLQLFHAQFKNEMDTEIRNPICAGKTLNKSFEGLEEWSASASCSFQENKCALSNLHQRLMPKPVSKPESSFKTAVGNFFKKLSFFGWRKQQLQY